MSTVAPGTIKPPYGQCLVWEVLVSGNTLQVEKNQNFQLSGVAGRRGLFVVLGAATEINGESAFRKP